jgi:hypothetical protein
MTHPTIKIYCRDSSHDDTPCLVETFRRARTAYWMPLGEWTRGRGRTSQRINALTDTYIDPSGPLNLPVDVRDRFRLSCETCGRVVVVLADTLGPILDCRAAAGVSELSLAGLAGILRRQA